MSGEDQGATRKSKEHKDHRRDHKDQSPQGSNASEEEEQWERRLLTGDLPEDFLKVTEPDPTGKKTAFNRGFEPEVGNLVDVPGLNHPPAAQHQTLGAAKDAGPPMSTEEQDRAMALALQEQLNMEEAEAMGAHRHLGGAVGGSGPGLMRTVSAPANMIGKLTVTVVEARLAKNYGYVKMDPYCRVRVGHSLYETPTCAKGSKEPKWNNTFTCYLLRGINSVLVEIYDECTFSQDALIAHGSFPIPETVIESNEVCDEWFSLSGNEGTGKEGMIHLILSLQPIAPGQPLAVSAQTRAAPNVGAGHKPMLYQTAYLPEEGRTPDQQPEPPKLSEEELEEFLKMFPNLDKEIILSVFQASRGNKEAMVNNLLQLGQQ